MECSALQRAGQGHWEISRICGFSQSCGGWWCSRASEVVPARDASRSDRRLGLCLHPDIISALDYKVSGPKESS